MLRAETLFSDWTIPMAGAPEVGMPLSAMATSIEGKYKIGPGLYAAARFDRLGFSEIVGSHGSETWDAPVTRAEIGGGYSLQRNLLLKLAYQSQHPRRRRRAQVGAVRGTAAVLVLTHW